jgi:hypothetical protein
MRISQGLAIAGVLAAGLIAAACTAVVVEDPGPGPRPRPRPGPVCPEIYAPVCASVAGRQRTYENLCRADADDARVLYRGECRRARPDPDEVDGCPRIFAPVCAIRRGDYEEFNNRCLAVEAGYSVVGNGSCDRFADTDDRGPVIADPEICTQDYRPVCASKRGVERTYGNACGADADGARILYRGEC